MEIQIKIEFETEVAGDVGEAFMDSILDHIRLSALRRGLGTPRLMSQMTCQSIKSIQGRPA